MPKAAAPSFVLELPVMVTPPAERTLLARLEAGRRIYNVVLQEALTRLALMRQSKAWQAAKQQPKSKARTAAFRACKQSFGFSEYALHAAAAKHKNAAGFADRLSANELQKLASRVWLAVAAYSFGQRGRPRFKGASRPLHSLEGKSNKQGIRWRPETGCVVWDTVVLPVRLPTAAQDPYVAAALQAKTKYCRLLWRQENGRRRWFVQLVQAGHAPAKYVFTATGRVGFDVGPSTIAVVAEGAVALEQFAPGVTQPWAAIRRLQRAQERSRRATNPQNYAANGTVKKGAKGWKRSARYQERAAQLAERERRLAARRKTEHGTLANQILGLGTTIQTEQLSYKAFQARFGRSVKVRAPGAFINLVTRKAERAGGSMEFLETWRLRMSQFDHLSNSYAKKPLSQRWHLLGGGPTLVQRDCYSAFLAQRVTEGAHDPCQLASSWPAAEALLRRAGLCVEEPVSGRHPVAPTVALPSESVARRRALRRGLSRDAVGFAAESPTAPRPCAPKTPRL